MGLNTIHNKSNDLYSIYNVSKKEWLRCEILPQTDMRKLEMAMGLDFNQAKYVIKVNGACNVELREKIKLGKVIFEVVSINPYYDNMQQSRFRTDLENFTGSTVIALE